MRRRSDFFVFPGLGVILLAPMVLMVLARESDDLAALIAPGGRLEKLAGDFEFTEGPAVDAEGNVFFTDQPNDRILQWSVDGELSVFLEPSGRSNGLYFDREGNLLACADLRNELWSIDPRGEVAVLVDEYDGKLLNGPNDLWVRPDGGVYFTDPFYRRSYWDRGPMEQDAQGVYYLSPDRRSLARVVDDLQQPNGIIGTPDGELLYVADIGGGNTYRYRINPDGSLTEKHLFCEMGSDGMTIDDQGNVYLTGRGVTVFDGEGRRLGNIPVDEPWTANVCFGGRDLGTLFITASKGLYAIPMRVRGVR
jgi:gluconolactonase